MRPPADQAELNIGTPEMPDDVINGIDQQVDPSCSPITPT